MKCAYSLCKDIVTTPQKCPKCKLVTYCGTNCRSQDWYKNHSKVCGSVTANPQDDYIDMNKTLGSGSYGEVKLVKNKTTQKLSAMKVVNKKTLEQEACLDIVMREISIHKELNHPNIVKLHDSFSNNDSIFLILEYVECGTLFQEIHKNSKLNEQVAKNYFSQTLSGIIYLHDNQLVHRDIKPENILINKAGVVKICDLG